MYVDVISKRDRKLSDAVKKLGFGTVFCTEDSVVRDVYDEKPFDLKLYSGKDYAFVISKGRADVVTDMENHAFVLNRGLCSKLKENGMFVMFKLESLVKTDQFYKVYKNFLLNGRMCADYSVPALYVSFASSADEMKSPMQLAAFAEHFGYTLKRYKKATELLLKRK